MKKSILAVAIPALFAANTAVAGINLVESDDITVNFNGDIDLRVINKDDKEGTQIEANFDDLDFTFTYVIDENMTVIAETDFTMEYEDDDALKNAGAWIGIQTDYGLLRGGYQTTSFDPLGIDNAEMLDNGMSSGDTDGAGTEHESSVVYEFETDSVWLSATYGKSENDDDGASDDVMPEVYQFAAIANIGDLEIGGGYGSSETQEAGNEDVIAYDATYYQVQAEYDFGDLTMAVLYGHQDEDVVDYSTDGIEFDMTYKINSKITVMGGVERLTQDIEGVSGNDDLDLAYIGMTYKFNKYVKLYVEAGKKEGDFIKYGKTSTTSYDQDIIGAQLGVDF